MNSLSGIRIYNSAYRRFDAGMVVYDTEIRDIVLSAESDSTLPAHSQRWLIPGLIDIHQHIESSMTTPTEFSNAVLCHGTTTFVSDCHEITNAAGISGLTAFMNFPATASVFYAIPSSVPAASHEIETSNGLIDESQIASLCANDAVIALGEIMNARELLSPLQNRTKRVVAAFRRLRPGCPIEGHCPAITGSELSAFIASGVDSDHTQQTPESIAEKAAKNMFLEIQYKSINKKTVSALSDERLAGHFCFCTDDVMPDVLVSEGHLDRVIRSALQCGMDVTSAIYAATYAPAQRMRLFDRGVIAPGKAADFVVLDDLASFSIVQVWKRGQKVYDRDTSQRITLPAPAVPAFLLNTIQRKPLTARDFTLAAPDGDHRVLAINRGTGASTATTSVILNVHAERGEIIPGGCCNIIASVERYGNEEPVRPALLANGLTGSAALCSSWAHDSHNLLVIATDAEQAARAVNLVITRGGGIAAVDSEQELFIPLPLAGIVSVEPMEQLAVRIASLRRWMRSHGYTAGEEIMNFAVLSLPVSPEIRITCKGLVLVRQQRVVDWLDWEGQL